MKTIKFADLLPSAEFIVTKDFAYRGYKFVKLSHTYAARLCSNDKGTEFEAVVVAFGPDKEVEWILHPKRLVPLDEHNEKAQALHDASRLNLGPRPNGLACPQCGSELADSNPWMSMMSNPPKYAVECSHCSFRGTRL